eukprot:CAMPEP_0117443152 /NCGR_PEP_ID=MMETSP0759-20121206/4543_1 /TAXON_ID=63605 /ORGANISM="Percolomonas cosmopolitus, Strain WS" /LENGTH=512 /DNA_ID=CAMNT_0005235109 /DNA_START=61 /DNA_END=1599 /DNA_ORIENTATION=+
MDAILALSRFRRRRFDDAIEISSNMLEKNYADQALWFIKCRSLTAKNFVDDTDLEDEGVAEILLEDNAMASAPRPGTSIHRPTTTASGRTSAMASRQGARPTTQSGRLTTGFARPGTSTRPQSRQQQGGVNARDLVSTAFQGSRPGTSRPVTSSGRFVRLGTASMKAMGDKFINTEQLDFKKYAKRPAIAKALCDYLIYLEHNPKKALELAALATVEAEYNDWWWKARLGKCYYQLGLYRDAEKQFKSALRQQDMVVLYLELCKVYLRMDQPNTALEWYAKGSHNHPADTHLILGIARVYDMIDDIDRGIQYYEKVLDNDSSNVEAIACLASNSFYEDQPEIALRLYRRLLQMGVNNTELWTNLALCCFYSSQYDMSLNCFERALALADDENMADVWYNVGQVAIGIGDLGLAYEAFKIAVSVDGNHANSFNCLGVLELRQGKANEAKNHFATACELAPHIYEPFYNQALLAFHLGDFKSSYDHVVTSLDIYPEHNESQELLQKLKLKFMSL